MSATFYLVPDCTVSFSARMQSVPDCTLLFYLGYCHSGAAVKAKDMKDVKPLQYAGWNNSLDVACLLIEHGANT